MGEAWMDLAGKVCIVTGGSSGIGEAIVSNLLSCGAKVVVADISANPEQAEHPDMLFVACNVAKKAEVDAMVAATLERFGRIDALVNNAGVGRIRLLVDVKGERPEYESSEDDFDFMVDVNQRGVFLCSQAVARVMVVQGSGVIVNISSEAGVQGSKAQSLYAGTKAAVCAFGLSWAKELGPYGVRVVVVEPAMNDRTNLGGDSYLEALAYCRGIDPGKVHGNYASMIPLGRLGHLDEIGDLVSYLVSDHASYITGTVIAITGGKSK